METVQVIMLITSILMPGRTPDIEHPQKVESAKECWDKAQAFTSTGLSDELKQMGAVGKGAKCVFVASSKPHDIPSSPDNSF